MKETANHSRQISYWNDDKYKESNQKQIKHLLKIQNGKKKKRNKSDKARTQ